MIARAARAMAASIRELAAAMAEISAPHAASSNSDQALAEATRRGQMPQHVEAMRKALGLKK
jgi:hypothetical protein